MFAKWSLVKKFAVFSAVVFLITGIILALTINWHLNNAVSTGDIQEHIDMVFANIIVVIIGGLLLLYILLLKVISDAANKLIKHEKELQLKNTALLGAFEQLDATYHEMVRALADAVDARDEYTAGHSYRVMQYSVSIGRRLDFPDHEMEQLRISALLHDIGKVGIPDEILHKQSKLSNEEFAIIKTHPEIGADILKNIGAFKELIPSVYHHHERYDGKGYPRNISGKDIPLNARIIAIADSYDAMTSNRPYRKSLTVETALNEIEKNKGQQFDPILADLFIQIMRMTQTNPISTRHSVDA